MPIGIHRFFGITLPESFETGNRKGRLPIEQVRERLHMLIQDCKDLRTQRLIFKISSARTAADLWMLRSDLHQCISQAHSQAEAATRINSLIKAFEGWLPSSQLTRI